MRMRKIQDLLQQKGFDAVLIAGLENICYLTNFSGSEGYLVVGETEGFLLVDARYMTQAEEEANSCRPVLLERGMKGVGEFLVSRGLAEVGLEAEAFTVAQLEQLRQHVKAVRFVPLQEELKSLRGFKSQEEVAWIRGAVDIAEDAWGGLIEMIRPGIQEQAVALEFEYTMKKKGSKGVAFDLIVASGPRSALPHAQPTDRMLEAGDFIIFDFGARHHGYNSDETCTIALGTASLEQERVYQIVKDAHDRAVEKVRPGVPLVEIDAAARDYIRDAGFEDRFGHGTGHGVGLAVHEWPVINKESEDVAEEGMVFTIEPGIYIPGWGGVRIEDMVLVTSGGCEVLTRIPKDLLIVRG